MLNLALVALLGLQAFALIVLSTQKHLPLPEYVERALEARLQDQGLSVRFSSLEVSLTGGLLFRDPQVFLFGTTEPVVEAKYLHVDPEWITLLWGHQLAFSEMRLTGAKFYCPPETSPTGLRELFINNLDTAVISEGNNWWRLDNFHAQVFNAQIIAQGTFLLPPSVMTALRAMAPTTTAPARPTTTPLLAADYRQWAQAMVSLQPRFETVQNPYLRIDFDGENPDLTKIQITLEHDGIKLPATGWTIGREQVRAAALLNGKGLQADGPMVVWTESVDYTQPKADDHAGMSFSANSIWAKIHPAGRPAEILGGMPVEVSVVAAPVKIDDFVSHSVGVKLDLRQWPNFSFNTIATQGQEWVTLAGQAAFDEKAGTVGLRGDKLAVSLKANYQTIFAAAEQPIPPGLNSLKLDQAPRVDGVVEFSPDQKFKNFDFVVKTEGAHFDLFDLTTLSAHGQFSRTDNGDIIDIQKAILTNKSWQAEGTYWENLRSHDFKLHARGNIEPRVLDPYLGQLPWWYPLWQTVVPGGHWPRGDVEYSSNWDRQTSADPLLIYAAIAGAKVRGVSIDELSLRVALHREFVTVYDLAAHATGGGQLTGTMFWLMLPPYDRTFEQHYIFDGVMPLAALASLGGSDVADILRPLESAIAPVVHVDQRIRLADDDKPDIVATKVHAELPGYFHAYAVPLDTAKVDAAVYDDYTATPRFFTDVSHLDFRIAGGAVNAAAQVTSTTASDGELKFAATLQNAQRGDFFDVINQFGANKSPVPVTSTTSPQVPVPPSQPSSVSTSKATGSLLANGSQKGLLDLVLSGRLLLNQPDSFVAAGHARIHNAELGQLQLFGRLSRMFADTSVPLGDFDINAAESDLQIAHGYLRLPNLLITGPSARITSAGTYHFDDDTLNFDTLIFPIGQWQKFGLKEISTILNPFNNTITLKLNGKIDKPEWKLSMNPLRLFENRTVAGPSIPDYPVNPDGSAVLPVLPTIPPMPVVAPVAKP